ncbi:MAG: hypothetical protein A3C61_02545 [Candidatus Yanofskybacteria bacterium RIFCSPHIGHO2_02_FULL_39_10]|uniref:Isoleucine--tRNA ligase n=1 Tax=Candidatus Yanofskybacteria bacterium RIFCSPHIGHO2_02_FULL_39_10 TaxID=1802674 RepID=A0A1F8F8P6_9BACT|nr:MAG: hypothetical protein A3C61_02545 [Candidatus Yanofskybacteria bacterium RIFCSPHIGHO2_02_FULL_39_10]
MYDFKKTESKILEFWHKNGIFDKSLALNKKGKRFVFFEGPPTANGRPGIHHFLGRAFKDLFNRYKTMRGFYVLRKAGWDTHGLPVEIEIEKELGFKNKKDIENYGIDKFNKKAKESVWKYKKEWEDMTRKMGFWVDLNNPYITYESNYIETLWYIIQQIWNKKLLYLAHKVVPFCVRCGTPLSSHEVAQGYKKVKDKSVFIKFKIKNPKTYNLEPNTFILAWTTTPWTLPGNVALAVRKDINYIVIKKDGEKFIVAEDLAEKVFEDSHIKLDDDIVINKFPGFYLGDLEYEPLFNIKELKSDRSYKVYFADFVSTEDGTGVVHTAVMYGEDDYELGTRIGLPKIHTVDEQGKFIGVGEGFDGMIVKHKDNPTEEKTTRKIIDYLKEKGALLKEEEYEHDYPFCWRCDSPLLYYAKSSWFIKMSAVKEQLIKNNSLVNWFPEHIKEGRFGQWIKEGKDWAFSRERYWGTPLPIWKCQKCEHYKVIGSIAEMEKNAVGVFNKNNNYYILRHGYTTRDERGEMIISSDLKLDKYHLTPEGIKQAEKNAEKIKNNYKIDLIYSSPFIRTTETAEIVAKLLHLKVHTDNRIREISHGSCDGKSHSKDCDAENLRRTVDAKSHELGESWNEVRIRIMDFMQEMESKHSGKNILIVSHGDPLWLLSCAAVGTTSQEIENNPRGFSYLEIAGFEKINWRIIPRNEYGELDLHRPFIDGIYLKCSECGASMKKIPDLIDVWFDSGAMPYAQWHWPFSAKGGSASGGENQDKDFDSQKMFKEQFPADFIVEGIDQTRGWFYTLLAISTLLGKSNPYKNVMSLGHVLDNKGKKMSKSKGNVISPFEVMEKVGADSARWYFYTVNTPGEYKNFSPKDAEAKLKSFIFILENCVRFYELYFTENPKSEILNSKQSPKIQNPKSETISNFNILTLNLLDRWVLSKFNGLVAGVSDGMDNYDPTSASRAIEKFVVEDLSQWWLRRSRKRKEALGVLRLLLIELSKIIAPFTPFIAEDIYHRLSRLTSRHSETGQSRIRDSQSESGHDISVHLTEWPVVNKKLINKKLEEEMDDVRNIVTAGLAIRKEKQIKVRQPLRLATITRLSKFKPDLEELIKEELNVKNIAYNKPQKASLAEGEKRDVPVILDIELDPALISEGYARELIRQIQDMRKEAGYRLDDKIRGQWHSDDKELFSAISHWSDEVKKEALFKEFVARAHDKKKYDVEKEFELVPPTPHQADPLTAIKKGGGLGAGRGKIWVGVRK